VLTQRLTPVFVELEATVRLLSPGAGDKVVEFYFLLGPLRGLLELTRVVPSGGDAGERREESYGKKSG
jgi:hypothetical protein